MNFSLSRQQQIYLLSIARKSIENGLTDGKFLEIDVNTVEIDLQKTLSSFVTLHINHKLRGCIGSLEAHYALVEDVARHAYAAAFDDPRFPALRSTELENIAIDISVLGPQLALPCISEIDLLEKLEPGVDGITIKEGYKQATFLPSVWEQLPDKQEFMHHLKQKAGLATNYWSDNLQIFRYHTFNFSE